MVLTKCEIIDDENKSLITKNAASYEFPMVTDIKCVRLSFDMSVRKTLIYEIHPWQFLEQVT